MKRVFKASDTVAKRALEATKRALEAKSPGAGEVTKREAAEVIGVKDPREKKDFVKNKRAKPRTQETCKKLVIGEKAKQLTGGEAGEVELLGEKAKQLSGRELHETQREVAPDATLDRSVSGAIGPDAMAEWNAKLAELCLATMTGAPKKLLLQKPSDLKLVDDLMRRANGVAGANAGSSHPGNLVQINFLDSVGKERQENIRVVTSPLPQDTED